MERFSLGFGPRLLSFRDRAGTEWRLALLPFGGYVSIPARPVRGVAGRPLDETAALAKALVLVGGPLANLVLAAALLFAQGLLSSKPVSPPVIAELVPDGPAARAGLLPGDRIVTVDGRVATAWLDVHQYVALRLDQPVTLRVERDGEMREALVRPMLVEVPGRGNRRERIGAIGARPLPPQPLDVPLAEAAAQAVAGTGNLVADTLLALRQLASGQRSYESVVGLIGMAQFTGMVVEHAGIGALLAFAALLSANLAVVNMLPLPVLDGGQLLLLGLERLIRRPLPPALARATTAGGILVIAAILVATLINDVAAIV